MASRKAMVGLVAFAAAATLTLASCGAGGGSAESGEIKGDITYLTNRTDLKADGTFDKYVAEFNKVYPDVNVKIEAITNFQDDVTTRLSIPNGYGDVLKVPDMSADKMPLFFEPLGKTAELEDEYRFLDKGSFEGTQYGIALGGNANGVLYNTEVFKAAGITTLPMTSEEFLSDLKKIKSGTSAIPLYTNYKDGWPLGTPYTGNVGAVSGNLDALNDMGTDKAPWTKGKDIYTIDSLLYSATADGLIEPDPLTTNWEQSKGDFANGKIATMVLGSWSISQFQDAAEAAGKPKDIVGFMPWPSSGDGKQRVTIGGDFNVAVNKNSSNKPAAEAWRDWMIKKSGYTDSQGMISALKSEPLPANLSSFADSGVELLELSPAPEGKESLVGNVSDKSKVDLNGFLYRQKLIDIARGQADGDMASYFTQLNKQWGEAVTKENK
ncbi:ABC transporter substrate-binding protein [Arthrobacter psychrochitiniphilus]|uniref:ABC transporter substrate-binding protein n=1 Tax=Arthrobacter psychrochitiniphilus TaxID=291045 RepID=UPI003F7C95EB